MQLATPTRPIGDRKFRYVPAVKTDVRRTFRKFRLLMRLQQRSQGAAA